MWSISEIDDSKHYCLNLCQSEDGKRFFQLAELGSERSNEVYFTTAEVPHDLLRKRSMRKISSSVLLDNYANFYTDAHNMWLVEFESEQLKSGKEIDEIQWVTDIEPLMPPR